VRCSSIVLAAENAWFCFRLTCLECGGQRRYRIVVQILYLLEPFGKYREKVPQKLPHFNGHWPPDT
jgi:hypothetical protein